MARDMASLLSQPSQATPPDAGPEQTQGQMQGPEGVQSLLQAGQQQSAPGQEPLPKEEVIKSALVHISEFQRGWRRIMDTPDIGKADIKGPFIQMMAQLMGDQYITLPQALGLMKSFPENPLQQRQFVEQHLEQDQKATMMLLDSYAKSAPPLQPGDMQRHMQSSNLSMTGHADRIQQLVRHFKGRRRA